MKIVISGLTITSTWGNGHGTLWRGLCRALHASGHEVTFFERDVPYYASHRDLAEASWCRIVLYPTWDAVAHVLRGELADADVAIVTSYCPDGELASAAVLDSHVGRKVFYDLDSPITLERLQRGEPVSYLPPEGLAGFDLVLSYAGGAAIEALKTRLGARAVAPLYGSVDPDAHYPVAASPQYRNDLSYIGTYAADRQHRLDDLFIAAARLRPSNRFALAGSQYPDDFPWQSNIFYFSHLAPSDHPSFFCSSGLTLNITRAAMATTGYCPSGRLFEATACGAVVLTDWWEGLDHFFQPNHEVLVATGTDDVLRALELSVEDRRRMGRQGRERTLSVHTATARAHELERLLEPSWREQVGAA